MKITPLTTPWQCSDPFLFCMHHRDAYPAGNLQQGPAASLEGREIGMDFEGKDGFSMYHGSVVPGFPGHPHRGFETVTLVREGLVDHSDSLGATARFGAGDVQWVTAGRGIVHSEMFPLVHTGQPNPLELFQLWLNLPRRNKLVDPYFSMFWREQLPVVREAGVELTVVAGSPPAMQVGPRALPAPPHSWASDPRAEVAIWAIKLQPGARFTLPAVSSGVGRSLYFFAGEGLRVDGAAVPARSRVEVGEGAVELTAGGVPPGGVAGEGGIYHAGTTCELLLLQGRPIGEPVAQHGPFVMNTRAELQQAFLDFQRTGFGGWTFDPEAPVHSRTAGRFARYPDGRVERPDESAAQAKHA